MKTKLFPFLILFLLSVIGCSSNDDSDPNPMNGRWHFDHIVYQTTVGESAVSSSGTLSDYEKRSYYQIRNGNVKLKEFESCETYSNYYGVFDLSTNKITLENSNSGFTIFEVHLQDNTLWLESSRTEIVNNVPTTYKIIQYCTR